MPIMRTSSSLVMLALSLFCLSASQAQVASRPKASPPPQVPSQALPNPDSLGGHNPGNYLAPLEVLRPLRERYAASPQWRDLYFEELAARESFVGNDAEAIADFDLARPPDEDLTNKDAQAAVKALDGYHPIDARQAILKLADTHRVIFINEAHHVPACRAFALSLLPGLYARGFRYFAAETLSEKDIQLQSRGYPTQKTGYYTTEPVFGDLVRTALKLGFKVMPYEYQMKPSQGFAASDNPLADEELREQGEAKNLYDRIFKSNPNAKVLLYAGYGHIAKKTDTITWSAGDLGAKKAGSGIFVPMAIYFQRLSGVIPFSIDQTNLYTRSTRDYENLLYRHIASQGLVKETPIVFRDATEQYYMSPRGRGVYDLVVCHPPVRYQNGRPDWLRMNGHRSLVALPADLPAPQDAAHSLLVQVFYANEDPSLAIPIDQIEMRSPTGTRPDLMLPPGRFLLQVVNGMGAVLSHRQIINP